MSRLIFILLLLCAAGTVAAQDTDPVAVTNFTDHPARVVRNINGLNVRRTPAIEDDNIVGRLQPGQQVHVLASEGDWQQVRSEDGIIGWSHSDYLIDLPPRELGETRKFRFHDPHSDQWLSLDARLQYIGEHSYIYSSHFVGFDRIGKLFDEDVYPETMALWDIDPKPSHEGDERVVILYYPSQYGSGTFSGGVYFGRETMPEEPNPYASRSGFLGVAGAPTYVKGELIVLAHELQHLIQHQVDRNEKLWVDEGLSKFTEFYLGYDPGHYANEFLGFTRTPLNYFTGQPFHYGAGFLFISYIYERFGIEGLQAYAARPEDGFDALDAQLAALEIDQDANAFFADWVLANFLQNKSLTDGRFGYSIFHEIDLLSPPLRGTITELPTQLQSESHQFATHYFEIALPQHDRENPLDLELELELEQPFFQDAWLQLVQIIAGEVFVERFAAHDHRGQPIQVSLDASADEAFFAISPFTPSDRERSEPTHYTLSIHLASGDALSLTTEAESRPMDLVPAAMAGDVVAVGWQLLNAGESGLRALVNERGSEALQRAAAAGHDDVVALLLLTTVDIHAVDTHGKTALILAEEAGHSSTVDLLQIAAVGYDSRNAPVVLTEDEIAFLAAASKADLPELRRLIDNGVNLHVRDSEGKTALMLAVESGNLATPSVLRAAIEEERAQLMAGFSDEDVRSYHAAAQSGNLSEVDRFLTEGIYVDVPSADKQTALMLAARSGAYDIVLRLLLAGADPNLLDPEESTALFHAIVKGHSDIVALLILNDLRLSNDGNLLHRDQYRERTALHLAAEFGQTDILRLLLTQESRGLDVNTQALGSQKTALFPAARLGRTEVAELLLDTVDPNLPDESGATPLDFAILFERIPIVELLLDGGADPNTQNSGWFHRTPLFLSCTAPNAQITELLLAAGSDPTLVDDNGQTAAQFARGRGLHHIARIIEQAAQRAN